MSSDMSNLPNTYSGNRLQNAEARNDPGNYILARHRVVWRAILHLDKPKGG